MNQAERDALIAEAKEASDRMVDEATGQMYDGDDAYVRVHHEDLFDLANAFEALSASRPVGEVEIARIIDPEAWAWKPLPRDTNEGPASKAAFDEQDRNDTRDNNRRKERSLIKARAILALTDGALASTANASTGDDEGVLGSSRDHAPSAGSALDEQRFRLLEGAHFLADEAPHATVRGRMEDCETHDEVIATAAAFMLVAGQSITLRSSAKPAEGEGSRDELNPSFESGEAGWRERDMWAAFISGWAMSAQGWNPETHSEEEAHGVLTAAFDHWLAKRPRPAPPSPRTER